MIHHYIADAYFSREILVNTYDEKSKFAGADLLTMVRIFFKKGKLTASQPIRDDDPFISEQTNGKFESFPREHVLFYHDPFKAYLIIGLVLYEVKPDISDSPYLP